MEWPPPWRHRHRLAFWAVWRAAKRVTALAILMFVAGLAAALTPADAAPPTPTVKIVNSNPLTVLLTSVPGGPFTSSFNLNVENDGPEIIASTDFTFTIVSDYPISSGDEPTIAPGKVANFTVLEEDGAVAHPGNR